MKWEDLTGQKGFVLMQKVSVVALNHRSTSVWFINTQRGVLYYVRLDPKWLMDKMGLFSGNKGRLLYCVRLDPKWLHKMGLFSGNKGRWLYCVRLEPKWLMDKMGLFSGHKGRLLYCVRLEPKWLMDKMGLFSGNKGRLLYYVRLEPKWLDKMGLFLGNKCRLQILSSCWTFVGFITSDIVIVLMVSVQGVPCSFVLSFICAIFSLFSFSSTDRLSSSLVQWLFVLLKVWMGSLCSLCLFKNHSIFSSFLLPAPKHP